MRYFSENRQDLSTNIADLRLLKNMKIFSQYDLEIGTSPAESAANNASKCAPTGDQTVDFYFIFGSSKNMKNMKFNKVKGMYSF